MKTKNNIPKTFFLFLLASAFIWFLITFSKEYRSTIIYNLSYKNIPQNKLLQESPDKIIKVTVKGSGFKIFTSKFKTNTLVLDASNLKSRRKLHYFLIKNQISSIKDQITNGIEVVDIEKDTIFLNLGSLVSKKLPISANLDIKYHVGYDLIEDIKISPDSILVSGPEKSMNSLQKIDLQKFTLNDVKDDFIKEVKIQKNKALENLKFKEEKITVSGIVDKFTEGVLKVPFTIKNVPDSLSITTITDEIEVKFIVALSKFNQVEQKLFTIECDYEKAIENNLSYLIPDLVEKPSFIKSYKLSPTKIDFLIRK